jgi:ABC-type Zn2+ transport system substrate-binding protein/surface adhesin
MIKTNKLATVIAAAIAAQAGVSEFYAELMPEDKVRLLRRIAAGEPVAMVGDAVREVSGGRVAATTLVGEGVDPHLFRPTRADIARLLGADAVFGVGHRLEGRMGDVLERVRAAGKPVVLMAETLPRASELCRHHFNGAFLELLVDRLSAANLRLSRLLDDSNVSVF